MEHRECVSNNNSSGFGELLDISVNLGRGTRGKHSFLFGVGGLSAKG